jgi:isopentenyl-diphosphate delta-isomerase
LTRKSRKLDHLRQALILDDGPADAGFGDLTLVHNCLPELNIDNVTTATVCAGLALRHPLIINAMTGGAVALTEVNGRLAEVAKRTDAVMAVGSQFAALEFPEVAGSFKVVRQTNPTGTIWANIGAYATVDDAKRVVDMLAADALQVHLNAAQEISMPEGDGDFSRWLRRIEEMARSLPVPVIVKETGCGMALEQVRQLAGTGIRAVDVGGAGGTNFIAIETARTGRRLTDDLLGWGIPTAVSALEAAAVLPPAVDLIVSGGVRTPVDAMKCFAIGARAVGIAAPIMRLTEQQGVETAVEWVQDYVATIRKLTMMLGKASLAEISAHPLVITGRTAQWLTARGINVERYARRSG